MVGVLGLDPALDLAKDLVWGLARDPVWGQVEDLVWGQVVALAKDQGWEEELEEANLL